MKIKDALRNEWPQLVLLAVPFLVLVPLWDKFPARVAIHWGLDGKPNGWADKEWGLLLLPVTNVGLFLLFPLLRQFDSRVKNYSPEKRASLQQVMATIGFATGCLMTGMALLIDAVALGWKVDVLRATTLGMLALLVVLGNYLPKLRPNRFTGIRTPWTLRSPEIWARTHRLFGAIMLVGSLVLMLPCLLLPSAWSVLLMLGFVVLLSLGAMVYSYALSKS